MTDAERQRDFNRIVQLMGRAAADPGFRVAPNGVVLTINYHCPMLFEASALLWRLCPDLAAGFSETVEVPEFRPIATTR